MTANDALLGRIAELTKERSAALERYEEADQLWRAFIETAAKTGLRVADIAEAAGISRERVYQIRDGRR